MNNVSGGLILTATENNILEFGKKEIRDSKFTSLGLEFRFPDPASLLQPQSIYFLENNWNSTQEIFSIRI